MPAELAADLAAYCAQTYGAGTEGGIDRRDNGPLCTERTHGGLGLLHHKVDPATVCSSQHQTDRYRKEGGQLVCLTDGGAVAEDLKIDLADYCRRNHGEAAIVSRRLTDSQPLCTVRGDGGLSQTHHAIDTRELCGGAGGSVSGDTLDCGAAAADAGPGGAGGRAPENTPGGAQGDGPATADGAPDAGPGGGVPETAIVRHADEPDLAECGLAPGIELVALGYPFPLALERWETGASPTPCGGLSGGFRPDLNAYCRDHFGGAKAGTLPDGRPICHPADYFPTGPEADGYWMILPAVCGAMYPQGADLRRGSVDASGNVTTEGSLYPVVKFSDGALECFYLDVTVPEFELRLMEGAHGDVREVADRIEFFGGPFFYDVVYETPPADPATSVAIEGPEGGAAELTLELSPVDGSDIVYRSEPFYIMQPSDLDESVGGDGGSGPQASGPALPVEP